jgi:hypothetical protein
MQEENEISSRRRRLSVIIEVSEPEEEEEAEEVEPTTDSDADEDSSSAVDDERIDASCATFSRLEWKATRSFLFGVVPLFLIPLPLFLFYYSLHLICEQLNNNSKSPSNLKHKLEQCNDINRLIPYMFFILVSLHALVNPITSLWLNKDFKTPSPIRRLRLRLFR